MRQASLSKSLTYAGRFVALMAVVGTTTLAAAKEAGSCRSVFAAYTSAEKKEALKRLKKYGDSSERGPHEITVRGGKGYIKIGYIDYTQREYMLALRDAVRMGAVAEIDTGLVVGPRVFPWLLKFASFAPDNAPVHIKGQVNPTLIAREIERGTKIKNPSTRGERILAFNEKEVKELEETMSELGIFEACAKHFPSSTGLKACFLLEFKMQSNDPLGIEWVKWEKPEADEFSEP